MYLMFTNENQTLYPGTFEYNLCLVMNELTKIVENNGGIIKPNKGGYIVNRSILEKITENENRIKGLKEIAAEKETTAKAKKAIRAAIKEYTAEIEKLKAIKNDPVRVDRTYIQFVLGDIYYYFGFPDNPFYDNYFTKTPVINGEKYSRNCYGTKDNKEWLFDSFWRVNCSQDDIKEAANLIFNMLINSKLSEKYRDGKKTRIPNFYDNGYHYETIYEPERFEKIEWLNQVEK